MCHSFGILPGKEGPGTGGSGWIFLTLSSRISLHDYDQFFPNLWSNLLSQQSGNVRECNAGKKKVGAVSKESCEKSSEGAPNYRSN